MTLAGWQLNCGRLAHVQPTRPKSRSYGTLRDGSVAKRVPGISCGIEIGRRTYAAAAHLAAWMCFLSSADALLARVALRHTATMMNFFTASTGNQLNRGKLLLVLGAKASI